MRKVRTEFLLAILCLCMCACASLGPPLPPSLELPKPPADLHAARKGNKVTLTWTVPSRTTDRRSVRYLGNTEICRGLDPALKQCGKPMGEAAPPVGFKAQQTSGKKPAASFVDILPETLEQEHPTGFATYAIEVLNTAGRGAELSNQVHVPLVPTLAPFPDFTAKVTPQGVVISWKCTGSAPGREGVTYRFNIYRRAVSDGKETRIAQMDATECATGRPVSGEQAANAPVNSSSSEDEFLDQSFEWEKTYFYRAAVVSVMTVLGKSPVEVEGEDTPEVKVFADDVFPPAIPSGLQAVFSGPGQQPFIDLVWVPDTDADLAGYNVYRREDGSAAVKLNAELVKAPAFRDAQVVSGKTYVYSVSAVDERGNESARSEEANERVP
jgi:hypothetical protein